uniref:LAGLIDADG endonuclease n=3 Tax=Ceratocystis TaxID=5157 RepID=A0A5C1VBM5_9PEZI|nr:intronic ORF at intron 5 of cox1 [Ceratocystis cacaofunesta]YP_009704209.1 LAGLIDADG endonuclease [Ceratocystis fimbriata]YP_009710361.1 LAGLIDADG endonuclease [Ceratocystis albifundus]AFO38122.1 intronic ORF at intron 5 of cox1 [Ceratocystis cacaofunesta]QEN73772.1 LAGLIDADG endonuclease [Ceratocystis fimbriata]QFX74863.1 LAGLIDADG endonuclease [Ceratocystis albifundus]
MSLVMLLYAGKASMYSFKYYIFIDTVKKLKRWSQSAGNTQFFFLKKKIGGTSETICDNTENIKNISIHVPTHLKPLNDEQFGHYLAGLIDGKGYFNTQQQLIIEFSSSDVKLAYYIKSMIGFGQVKKVKDKNVYIYIISNKFGIIKTINLINGKLRIIDKFNQDIDNILTNLKENIEFKFNDSNNLINGNYWITGFSDAGASFQIEIVNKINEPKPEIRLNLKFDKQDKNVLILIKEVFGGIISYEKLNNSYTYNSNSFGSARKILNYFDNFHLQSNKYVNYLKWRKAYIIVQEKNYLTERGMDKIIKLKNSININSV